MCALLLSQFTDAVQDAFLCFIEWFCHIVIKKMQKIIPTSESVMLALDIGMERGKSCGYTAVMLWIQTFGAHTIPLYISSLTQSLTVGGCRV
jgi:hypothetical protein